MEIDKWGKERWKKKKKKKKKKEKETKDTCHLPPATSSLQPSRAWNHCRFYYLFI